MNILVLNCGSSSAKFAVIDTTDGQEHMSGIAQRLGTPQATVDWKFNGKKESSSFPNADHNLALREVVTLLKAVGLADGLRGIGHRVLHGGAKFSGSMPVSPEVIAKVEECIPLGPLHNPPNLLGIRICQELFPKLAQVAVFDTAFHQTMPAKAYTYAIPHEWTEKFAVRRYGFHGTSHRFVSAQAVKQLGLNPADSAVIVAHLGNGCSCAAVRNGKCVDTTMGLTPLEGVVMGTRSGSVDPALVGFMAKNLKWDAEKVIDALNKQSGLLGVSGLSNDMRTVLEAADQGSERAKLAVEIFCYVMAKTIASLVVATGRLDALVFTGGIGENSAVIRAKVCEQLAFLGFTIDAEQNKTHGKTQAGRVSVGVKPQVAVVPTNEELMIAMDTAEIVGGKQQKA
jgi:acetate kinase